MSLRKKYIFSPGGNNIYICVYIYILVEERMIMIVMMIIVDSWLDARD